MKTLSLKAVGTFLKVAGSITLAIWALKVIYTIVALFAQMPTVNE